MSKKIEPEIGVGIDFGTSNSCSGVYINGNVKIVPNKIGERITPSVVLFKSFKDKDKNNNEVIKEEIFVGEEALCEPIGDKKNYIYEIKRFIGLDYEDFEESGFKKYLDYDIENIDGSPKVKIDLEGQNKYYSIEEISSFIIKKILQCTEDFIAEIGGKGLKIKNAVFTVPSQFTDKQKKSILIAAQNVGIEIPRIINEPTAAALAYGLGKDLNYKKKEIFTSTIVGEDYKVAPSANQVVKYEEKVMVFDLGGGTLDLTILSIKKTQDNTLNFDILLTEGDIHLGGSDFDNILKDYCIEHFCAENEINKEDVLKDYKACRRLKMRCESVKKLLGINNNVLIQIDNFYKGNNLVLRINQKTFKEKCHSLYERIKAKIDTVLKDAKLSENDIDNIILIGGATRIYGVKNLLIKKFGEKKIKDSINPDEAVAVGATLEAAKIQVKDKMNFNLQDIIPYNLGIAVQNQDKNDPNKEVINIIIKKFSKIPCRKEKRYKVLLSDQNPDIFVAIYEGKDDKYIPKDGKLGTALITGMKKRGCFIYKIVLDVDVNGKLTGYIISDELNINKEVSFTKKYHLGIVSKNKIKINKNKKLETIASVASNIQNKKEIISKSQDINEKLNNLIVCSEILEELINNYKFFAQKNESLYEKISLLTKELFEFYIERIKLKKEDINKIIAQIKERMLYIIKEPNYLELLMIVLKELKSTSRNEFFIIFCNYMEMLNNEGIKRLSEGKFGRYYAKIYFEKVFFGIKRFVNDDDLGLIQLDIKEKYDAEKKKNEEELKKINSFYPLIDSLVKEKEYLPNLSGLTLVAKQIGEFNEKLAQKKEISIDEATEILDIFQNMINSIDKNERSIEEAYCLAAIIQINFEILQIQDYDKLGYYIERFNFIIKGKVIDDYTWYKDIKKIIDLIMAKKK